LPPNGANFKYNDEEQATFKDPAKLFEYRIKLERTSNGLFQNLVLQRDAQRRQGSLPSQPREVDARPAAQ
jgi:hypothetical protein